jgi:hypothetical protein
MERFRRLTIKVSRSTGVFSIDLISVMDHRGQPLHGSFLN